MRDLIDTAYNLGGVWGVVTLGLVVAVVYLYRAREREHRERLREMRKNTQTITQLLDTAARRSSRPGPLPSLSIPPGVGDEDEEPTVVTHIRQQQVHELVIRYLDED